MRFAIIDPGTQTAVLEDFPNVRAAYKHAGLNACEIDHGIVSMGLAIVVHEYSLFEPAEQQHYFSIAGKLYAGKAVLYAFDIENRGTIDLLTLPAVVFLPNKAAVERLIEIG